MRRVIATLLLGLLVGDAQLAAAKIASYREPPYGACRYVQEQFGATPDPWQEQTLIAVCDPTVRRISLQACAGPGKTTAEAWTGLYFLGTQCTPGEHPNGLATSITKDNLRDNLWKELAKWQAHSEYMRTAFTWSADRIVANDHPATWFLSARTWPKSGSAEEQGRTFSGLHGANVLVLVDESGSIPPTILRAAEQAIGQAAHFGLILQGGNPISLEGMLHEAANRLRSQWLIIRVTGDPDDPKAWVHNPRVAVVAEGQQTPAAWAREQIATYGRDNPWVKSYILGQFPPQSINALLGIDDVEKAMARVLDHTLYSHIQKRIGVDVARFGDDRTVLFPRQGLQVFNPVVMRGANTNQIVARVMMAKQRWGSELELIDNSFAWGNGVVDNLLTAGQSPHAVDFAGKAVDPRYRNRRAEGWIAMAKAIKAGVALPPTGEHADHLIAELTTPTYTFHDGQFMLEEKDHIKKRLGRSPDLGDGLALTYMLPDMPAQLLGHLRRRADGQAITDGVRA